MASSAAQDDRDCTSRLKNGGTGLQKKRILVDHPV